jgi:nitroreductase
MPQEKILAERSLVDGGAKLFLDGIDMIAIPIQSAAAAIAYLLLALNQSGLSSLWLIGPLLAKIEIEKILKVPVESDVVAMIAVGYPGESPSRSRKPVGEVYETIK